LLKDAPQLVEYAHFNDKYPQFKNILITNTQNNLAYKYDIKKKQFVAINKDDLLEDIVDARMCDINSFYEELEEELDTKTKEILDKVKVAKKNPNQQNDRLRLVGKSNPTYLLLHSQTSSIRSIRSIRSIKFLIIRNVYHII
jgi:hypothetical protein